jgi:hypothetical protein
MIIRVSLALMLLMPLACSGSVDSTRQPSAETRFGPPERMSAVFFGGQEVQTLRLCPTGQCHPQRSHDEECWADVPAPAATEWATRVGGGHMRTGQQRVEILGRRRIGGGRFGHLNQFACEIRVERVFGACAFDMRRLNRNVC